MLICINKIYISMYNKKLMYIFGIIIYVWFLYGSDGFVSVLQIK